MLPALHGAGDEIMLLLSVSEDFGDPGRRMKLVPAMTGIDVVLMDGQGDVPWMLKAISDPDEGLVGGRRCRSRSGICEHQIIVNGMQVMVDADLAKCTGTGMEGPWNLSSLTSLKPEATAGGDKFAGLDADIDPLMNRSPGWIKFARGTLTCEVEYGDGDPANVETFETADGVPAVDDRILHWRHADRGGEIRSHAYIRRHGTSRVEVHHSGPDFRGLVDPEVSTVLPRLRR